MKLNTKSSHGSYFAIINVSLVLDTAWDFTVAFHLRLSVLLEVIGTHWQLAISAYVDLPRDNTYSRK